MTGPSHFAGAVGTRSWTRSRARRRRLSDNDIRCSASDRRWFPARPAQHFHRRRNNGKGRIPSALASAHGRNGKRRVETWSSGRAGAHRPSEALHPTRSSDVLPRIARERVPTVAHVANQTPGTAPVKKTSRTRTSSRTRTIRGKGSGPLNANFVGIIAIDHSGKHCRKARQHRPNGANLGCSCKRTFQPFCRLLSSSIFDLADKSGLEAKKPQNRTRRKCAMPDRADGPF
jgi:hypothetical protein